MCCDIDCRYIHKCTSYKERCNTCRHNRAKRDYYDPEPWTPWYPWYPYINPWWPYWDYQEPTGTITDDTDKYTWVTVFCSTKQDYYSPE